jgi:hypothetical protein
MNSWDSQVMALDASVEVSQLGQFRLENHFDSE